MIMADDGMRIRRWTRLEYDRLIEAGFFPPGDSVELLGGQLMVAEPQGSRHAAAVSLVADALRKAFGTGWYVMVQLPIALDDESEPEPDVAVVPGTARLYWDAHPSAPVLVVEVAESSAALDRGHKSGLYARAGVPDYWLLDLAEDALEVYRRPVPTPDALYRWRYGEMKRLARGATVAPEAVPSARVSVADLLR
jgi:Uma2 family endonuclease